MKLKLILFLILILTYSITTVASAQNDMIKNPMTLYVGGTGPGNYTSIQNAIDNATNGDTIYVYDDSSPYYELLTISSTIILIGENKETTIIDGSKQKQSIISVNADNTTITGFTIQNSVEYPNAGIYLHANNTHIHNNTILNNNVGICLEWAKNNTIASNKVFRNNWHGIELISSSHNTIKNNEIQINPERGLTCHFSRNNLIFNNNITCCGIGLALEFYSEYNKIHNNTLMLNRNEGIFVRAGYNIIVNNYVRINKFGILFATTDNFSISHNTMINNLCGLAILYSTNAQIHFCTFKHNLLGIYIQRSNNIQITQNNFRYNIISGFFKDYYYNEEKLIWNENFWNRPHICAYPVIGRIGIFRFIIEYDYNPADDPYGVLRYF